MAKYTVIYGTNTMIPDESGNLRSITFFQDIEGKNKEDVSWEVGQRIAMHDFIEDNGGYHRRTSTIVSFKIKERVSMTNTIINSGGINK